MRVGRVGVVLGVVLCVCLGAAHGQCVMRAHFIDVGQGDCTLLEFPCAAMLIDAGAQDDAAEDALIAYLEEFFDDHPDLDETFAAVFVTHSHVDHTRALPAIAERFTIERYVYNDHVVGSGRNDQQALLDAINAGTEPAQVRTIADSEITALPDRTGLTDAIIDSIACAECDPVIRVLASSLEADPGWPAGEFENENNQSLVTRVDLGESSFLFTGDLEDPAIETLVDYYAGTDMLDVDVYQVGHHGASNGTTTSLVEAMTPHAAVISMGRWDFGRRADGSATPFTTFAYGHPREGTLEMLEDGIPGYRSRAVTVMVARAARDFEEHVVRRRVYATGWDGTVVVRATPDRRYRITVGH